jgi:hypothetical protein
MIAHLKIAEPTWYGKCAIQNRRDRVMVSLFKTTKSEGLLEHLFCQ